MLTKIADFTVRLFILQELVFKLWANYLSKLGVAFSDGELCEILQKYDRQRYTIWS